MDNKNSLGCGLEVDMNTNSGFICGVADGWGHERLCKKCYRRLRLKWDEEDQEFYKRDKRLKHLIREKGV